ncbi:hypothetical protein AGMMS49573_02330 [Endomicrobiia bacterium]|uniref:hypothetical protein n=1 Tax=Endomicrobium trichonymphae TaxID=1408204 RepID=UPI000BAA7E80|nr:hypothetical protein [Candidatus Endomicrobium trichonymphae]GHT15562.1 hypothetical protein AGMMS49573_02330 [Endomicrobiia bacterium]GHT24750.1 hypothetical protein AGMMS49953_07950 [Endomicrobiia bacterium]GHT24773.1 hypothetical protein AGMMS49953_08040 [Endomicrobiia bacterium]
MTEIGVVVRRVVNHFDGDSIPFSTSAALPTMGCERCPIESDESVAGIERLKLKKEKTKWTFKGSKRYLFRSNFEALYMEYNAPKTRRIGYISSTS